MTHLERKIRPLLDMPGTVTVTNNTAKQIADVLAAREEWREARLAIFAGKHTPAAFDRLATAEKALI